MKFLNVEKGQMNADDMYNWAAARALTGESTRALSSIRAGVNTYGFRNFSRVRHDVAFRPLLAKDPNFKKTLDELEKKTRRADQESTDDSEPSTSSPP
jgi:hypothetical protein